MRGILLAVVIMFTAIDADARGLVPRGRYEIAVAQEGAKTRRSAEPIKIEECITKSRIISAQAFHARSGHPVAQCPITDVRFNGEELLYRTACADAAAGKKDAPSAKATFVQTRTGYEGSIVIALGDTKKRVTEHHRAQRIGECAEARSPHIMGIDAREWRERRLRGNW